MRKKIKIASSILLGLMLSATNINAQAVSDFENLTLSPNSFWDGSDQSGTHQNGTFNSFFLSGNAVFPNVYDTSFGAVFGFWSSGFAYSNIKDSTTAGVGNLYAARAGSGFNNSQNYAVGQNNSINQLTPALQNTTVSGVFITNGTYPALSMKNGDAFAKIFGGASGNDPDWFLLTIKGYSNGVLTNNSVEFYLADYRFSDNTQDYIVENWQWVDLTGLGAVDSVQYFLTSSDTGAFGMNTPAFFCLDNFNDQTVAVKEITLQNTFSIYPNPATDNIYFNTENTIDLVEIIDVTGKTLLSKTNLGIGLQQLNVAELTNGIYFVRILSGDSIKISRLIKN
ncbi:MAG: PEP-CTERM sorting domain-containing protein [Bacteroidetes bacterium HGW-Bacteroidetes-12]|nr:MAG: PEP-CTERM sorting domain-containing protein [Bacteroidetes bacterium HGW-Bacteroidetes-12]